MKRILSFMLSLVLCFSLLPVAVPVNAASVDDLSYEIIDGEVTITDCNASASGELVIPDTIEGYPVTTIGEDAFALCTKLTSVIIPDSVTGIGDYAFRFCTSLTDIVIPGSVISVGAAVFRICEKLTSVTIMDGVTSIGNCAFDGCVKLSEITIPKTVTNIGNLVFRCCYQLNRIQVAADNPSYKNDVAGALLDKSGTTLIHVPSNITGDYFVPEGVTTILEEAFYYSKVSSITIPESVTDIESYLFYSCRYLTGIWVAEGNPAYKSDASGVLFDKNGTTLLRAPQGISGDYVLPEGVSTIRGSGFCNCSNLTSVTFPKSVTSIGYNAFEAGSNLERLYFAGNAPKIDRSAFYYVDATIYYHTGSTGWNKSLLDQLDTASGDITLQKADHIWSAYTYNNNHTCTTDGTELAVCLNCGEQDIRKAEGTAAHRFAYTSNQDATCTTDGTKTGVCRICGFTETVPEVGSAGHHYSDYISNNDATCTQDGTKTALCSTCGHADTITDEGSGGHNYSDYISNNDATCTKNGTKTAVCTTCGHTDTVIDSGTALGHDYSDYASNNDATCTEDGTLSSVCANCGNVRTLPDEGSALGHSFTNYISDGNFTCTLDSTETAKCDRCDATHWRIDEGSADHRYLDGFCLFCGKALSFAKLTGNITTYGEGTTLIEATPVGKTAPVSSLSIEDNAYCINVITGTYILTVFKTGYTTRSYQLTLNEGENTQDVTLHRLGDINGDGKTTVADVSKAYAHAKETKILTGYNLACADANGDGKVNVGDTARLYAHAKKTSLLW